MNEILGLSLKKNELYDHIAERVRDALNAQTEALFAQISRNEGRPESLVLGIPQPEKRTPDTLRLVMTRQIDEAQQDHLIVIGMNPSWARDFQGSKTGKLPETDDTAERLYKWIEQGVYSDGTTDSRVRRITLINLIPWRNPKSSAIAKGLKDLDLDDEFERIAEVIFKVVCNHQYGTPLIVLCWGAKQSWKRRYINLFKRLIEESGFEPWRFGTLNPKNYPPNASPLGILRNPPYGGITRFTIS